MRKVQSLSAVNASKAKAKASSQQKQTSSSSYSTRTHRAAALASKFSAMYDDWNILEHQHHPNKILPRYV